MWSCLDGIRTRARGFGPIAAVVSPLRGPALPLSYQTVPETPCPIFGASAVSLGRVGSPSLLPAQMRLTVSCKFPSFRRGAPYATSVRAPPGIEPGYLPLGRGRSFQHALELNGAAPGLPAALVHQTAVVHPFAFTSSHVLSTVQWDRVVSATALGAWAARIRTGARPNPRGVSPSALPRLSGCHGICLPSSATTVSSSGQPRCPLRVPSCLRIVPGRGPAHPACARRLVIGGPPWSLPASPSALRLAFPASGMPFPYPAGFFTTGRQPVTSPGLRVEQRTRTPTWACRPVLLTPAPLPQAATPTARPPGALWSTSTSEVGPGGATLCPCQDSNLDHFLPRQDAVSLSCMDLTRTQVAVHDGHPPREPPSDERNL